ncbi:hypothetical protein SERLA73DRAFT_188503 [Serpula lacrymans var. lacrymans S7.3]|uniref:Nucleoporin protein Ndc1-Nup n=2 Tax=Serpula lacrymans var. lacrymans TaxID=341189 RepID=F8QBF7_SERL3|nr:uncharacterized protein SERLADRAFT_478636 [Serpula lacrymans var. lacrymans S7.9]EGN94543.1 hypothetical protein SERLA73DRAFT_188503 [Serpula lacrymans var. lacrymans S7.3]EGO20023.1 hypothetical protein SERLADRAFT_478636 [Serpula lacrymans var. lacrymans S7.9]
MSATATPLSAKHPVTHTLAFTSRSSPSIPPAVQAYEPLLKSVLGNRLLYNIFAYSALFSFTLSVLFIGNGDASLGLLTRLVRSGTWAVAATTWVVGVLPVAVLRKVYLTGASPPATSPSKILQNALGKPSTLRSLSVYVTSAIFLAVMHVTLAKLEETSGQGDRRLSVFVKSRKHPYYLNGRFIFLMCSQAWLAGTFFLRNIMLDRFVFRFSLGSPTTHSRRWLFSVGDLMKLLLTISLFVTLSFGLYGVAFGLARSIILPILFKIPILHHLLRPFTAHFLRGSWTLLMPLRNFSLVLRTLSLGMITLVNWEFAEALFDVYIPQPIKTAQTTADPSVTLISGISSQDPIFRQYAYSELIDLALEDSPMASERRTTLFGDQKYNPSLWSSLAREALLALGRDYQLLLRRGKPVPVVAPSESKPVTKTPQAPSTPLIRQPIFKASRQSPLTSVLDSFASDSKLAEAVEITAEASKSNVPELFRSVMHVPASTPQSQKPSTTSATVIAVTQPVSVGNGLIARIKGKGKEAIIEYCPHKIKQVVGSCIEWWGRERINKVVEACLPHRELDALVVEVLSRMVCASLTEDRFGVVQRDIPRILEAFLSFLSAIEEYHQEVNALYTPPSPEELSKLSAQELGEKERKRIEVARAAEVFGVVGDALKAAVARIALTFGDKLLAFKFPPRTAKKLQAFVDYN